MVCTAVDFPRQQPGVAVAHSKLIVTVVEARHVAPRARGRAWVAVGANRQEGRTEQFEEGDTYWGSQYELYVGKAASARALTVAVRDAEHPAMALASLSIPIEQGTWRWTAPRWFDVADNAAKRLAAVALECVCCEATPVEAARFQRRAAANPGKLLRVNDEVSWRRQQLAVDLAARPSGTACPAAHEAAEVPPLSLPDSADSSGSPVYTARTHVSGEVATQPPASAHRASDAPPPAGAESEEQRLRQELAQVRRERDLYASRLKGAGTGSAQPRPACSPLRGEVSQIPRAGEQQQSTGEAPLLDRLQTILSLSSEKDLRSTIEALVQDHRVSGAAPAASPAPSGAAQPLPLPRSGAAQRSSSQGAHPLGAATAQQLQGGGVRCVPPHALRPTPRRVQPPGAQPPGEADAAACPPQVSWPPQPAEQHLGDPAQRGRQGPPGPRGGAAREGREERAAEAATPVRWHSNPPPARGAASAPQLSSGGGDPPRLAPPPEGSSPRAVRSSAAEGNRTPPRRGPSPSPGCTPAPLPSPPAQRAARPLQQQPQPLQRRQPLRRADPAAAGARRQLQLTRSPRAARPTRRALTGDNRSPSPQLRLPAGLAHFDPHMHPGDTATSMASVQTAPAGGYVAPVGAGCPRRQPHSGARPGGSPRAQPRPGPTNLAAAPRPATAGFQPRRGSPQPTAPVTFVRHFGDAFDPGCSATSTQSQPLPLSAAACRSSSSRSHNAARGVLPRVAHLVSPSQRRAAESFGEDPRRAAAGGSPQPLRRPSISVVQQPQQRRGASPLARRPGASWATAAAAHSGVPAPPASPAAARAAARPAEGHAAQQRVCGAAPQPQAQQPRQQQQPQKQPLTRAAAEERKQKEDQKQREHLLQLLQNGSLTPDRLRALLPGGAFEAASTEDELDEFKQMEKLCGS